MAIAFDLGERYLDTIYQSNRVDGLYGEQVPDLRDEPTAQAEMPASHAS